VALACFASSKIISFASGAQTLNSLLTVVLLIGLISYPLFIASFLRSRSDELEDEVHIKKFGALYINIRLEYEEELPLLQVPLQLIRDFVLALVMVFVEELSVEVSLMTATSFFMVWFNAEVTPFSDLTRNRQEVFNEYILVASGCIVFALTAMIPERRIRYNVGWLYIGLVIFCIIINLVLVARRLRYKVWRFWLSYSHSEKSKQEALKNLRDKVPLVKMATRKAPMDRPAPSTDLNED